MTSRLPPVSVAESASPEKSEEEVLNVYQEVFKGEAHSLSQFSSGTLNSMLTFTGLFAAVVAAFLVESYKDLKPDAGDQTVALLTQIASSLNATSVAGVAGQPPPFRAPRVVVVINALWFCGLSISLMCALLTTLIQEWSRRFVRAQVRPAAEGFRRYSRRQMLVHRGVQRYGLDRIASFVIALMHTAVILFLIGLDLFVFSLHHALAIAVITSTGVGALFYAITSFIPLFDEFCPYYSPLTQTLTVIVVIPASTIFCVVGYIALVLCVPVAWLKTRTLDPIWGKLLSLRRLWGWIWRPFDTLRVLRSTADYVAHPLGDSLSFMDHLSRATFDVREHDVFFLKAGEWDFLWGHVGDYILTRPRCIYWVGSLLDLDGTGFYGVFVGLRNNPYAVAQIAAALGDVTSTFAAVGSVKMLQAMLQAESVDDDVTQDSSDGDARWAMMGPIIDAMDGFVKRLDEVNQGALARGDARIVDALSKFRWMLLRLWNRIPVPPSTSSFARDQLQRILGALDRQDNSIRLLPVSSNDGATDGTLTYNEDRRPELASRNAFMLLVAVHRTGWRGYWESAETPLVDTNTSMWRWKETFTHASQRRRKPPASNAFRDFLLEVDERLRDWMRPGSDFADPVGIALHPFALRVLHDLASTVDLTVPNKSTDGDGKSQVPPAGLAFLEAPISSPALSSAEEGSLNSAIALTTFSPASPPSPSPRAALEYAPQGAWSRESLG